MTPAPKIGRLVILIPPAHTTPAILPLGDGSLCHPRGLGSGIFVRQLFGGGVGWRLYLTYSQPAQQQQQAAASSSSSSSSGTAGNPVCPALPARPVRHHPSVS